VQPSPNWEWITKFLIDQILINRSLFPSEIVNEPGMDVFGQLPVKKQQDCVCPNCSRTLAANRFAPHLEKCMGMGRNSSRIASKRLRGQGPVEGEYNDDNDVDVDWMEYEKKSMLSMFFFFFFMVTHSSQHPGKC